jgi:two-component system, OmpR family, phosphate regulon sensor histidine kinase PhoR
MRKRRSLAWQLFPTYILAILASVMIWSWMSDTVVERAWEARILADLKAQATVVEHLVQPKLRAGNGAEVDALLKEMGRTVATRVTVITPSGQVLGDSQVDLAHVARVADQPEIQEALKGKVASATRFSLAADERVIYCALPVTYQETVIGVVRTAGPVTSPAATLRKAYAPVAVIAIGLVLLALFASVAVARILRRPIDAMTRAADRFAAGDLFVGIDVPETEELASLTVALNKMAAQLRQRLSSVTSEKNEMEAVLSAMVEAVLLVDSGTRILQVNMAAEKLFQISGERVRGRAIQEIIRHTDLHRFVNRALASKEPIEADIAFIGDPDKFLQAHGVPLTDAENKSNGALIVLNDVTRLRTLEKIRRDFVANVSHELKTPITSIKGFLETLKEGGIEDPENAQRFLTITIKHTDRLTTIIEDLLSLSRIETDAEKGEIALEETPLREVFEAVAKSCNKRAEAKNMTLELDLASDLVVRINPTLLEQAIVNLVDNAIKYSEPESVVRVETARTADEVIIKVEDHGCGIPKEHLDRIFERFYRVDKARSRKVGGTGLGLAIVRHIVSAHNGKIRVESSPGRGSTFFIHLPA